MPSYYKRQKPGRGRFPFDAKPTDCPGRHFSVAQVRQMATHLPMGEDDQIENAVLRMAKVQTQQPASH